jgi:hypothetical protein
MTYARAAVERAMKVYEVLVQALRGGSHGFKSPRRWG